MMLLREINCTYIYMIHAISGTSIMQANGMQGLRRITQDVDHDGESLSLAVTQMVLYHPKFFPR